MNFAYCEKLVVTINDSPRIRNWIASVVESRTSDNSDHDNRTPFLEVFITRENSTFRFQNFRNRLYHLWYGKNLDKRTKSNSFNFWCVNFCVKKQDSRCGNHPEDFSHWKFQFTFYELQFFRLETICVNGSRQKWFKMKIYWERE